MATDTLTDNELIAEFMGGVFYGSDDLDYPNKWWFSRQPHEGYRKDAQHLTVGLRYNIDWSWLMPVVEKIAQHVYESYPDHNGYKEVIAHDRAYPRTFGMIDSEGRWMVRINRMPLEQEDSLIKATYKAVVEFIKWYNQQQKP